MIDCYMKVGLFQSCNHIDKLKQKPNCRFYIVLNYCHCIYKFLQYIVVWFDKHHLYMFDLMNKYHSYLHIRCLRTAYQNIVEYNQLFDMFHSGMFDLKHIDFRNYHNCYYLNLCRHIDHCKVFEFLYIVVERCYSNEQDLLQEVDQQELLLQVE